MRLTGKVAVVTGGAAGIGRATAILFAREGASVTVIDLDEAGGDTVVQSIGDAGGRASFVRADVSRQADCQKAIDYTVAKLGEPDILFNNAGIIRRATILDTNEEEWDRLMAVNLKSVYLMSRLVVPHMIRKGGGVIINAASGWGLTGGRKAAAYCASKAAVVNLTRAMALDHGHQGIRVNSICPGDIDTGMLREEAMQLDQPESLFLSEAADRPLGRIGRPEDVAEAVIYLASDAAAFVTGSALVVDGGGLAG